MRNEFKAGDLVYVVSRTSGVRLLHIKDAGGYTTVAGHEIDESGFLIGQCRFPYAFHATPEYREHLVGLVGEDAVPKLPLRGSELAKMLLEQQKYVLCLVSHVSDDNARRFNPPKLHIVTGVESDYFNTLGGISADFAVPVDMNGNEITEIE